MQEAPLDLFIENGPELMLLLLLAACFLHQRPSTRRHKGALGGDGNGQTQICSYHSMASIEILVELIGWSLTLGLDMLGSACLNSTQIGLAGLNSSQLEHIGLLFNILSQSDLIATQQIYKCQWNGVFHSIVDERMKNVRMCKRVQIPHWHVQQVLQES